MRLLFPIVLVLLFGVSSCDYFKSEEKPEAVARVGKHYLFKEALEDLVPEGTTSEDSLVIVRNFIDRWATQMLLIQGAELNLSTENLASFNKLIEQYKTDLYTKAYLEDLVSQSIDTVVEPSELKRYYDLNKENFKTNGTLVRLRYIHLPKDHPKLEQIKGRFFDFKKKDAAFWENYQLQFINYAFNDSVWVELNQVYRKLPFITPDNRDKFIQAGMGYTQPDSTSLYFVKVSQVIEKDQISPFGYLQPTLKELLINQRKLELIKNIEREITEDAIKNKKYEIYKKP
ncbi:hypothetical protein [Flavobacterium orientale]|uniref:Peptidylprolyl isomerase n=1 Tax=Flavobacterium orientale TaxID=1756020 RepID=A0A917DEC4_9FLAO|nr:hypothetical protein [Flavobacterium orientale]GGD30058.1 hypothetical protein GCM10011343_20370 [Flavobacterium orientale]